MTHRGSSHPPWCDGCGESSPWCQDHETQHRQGIGAHARVVTTKTQCETPGFTDLAHRVVTATRANALYVGDITLSSTCRWGWTCMWRRLLIVSFARWRVVRCGRPYAHRPWWWRLWTVPVGGVGVLFEAVLHCRSWQCLHLEVCTPQGVWNWG